MAPTISPASQRVYKSKSKNAQEAHEAIRPTSVMRRPQDVAQYLDENQLKLYELIWKRTVACQMENAVFDQVSIDIANADKKDILRATGSTLVFDGFLKLYQEGVDEQDDQDDEKLLPAMNVADPSAPQSPPISISLTPSPSKLGEKVRRVGNRSPFHLCSMIQVLQGRSYVKQEKRQFIPEERADCHVLVKFFYKYIEYDFTANLEEQLD